MRAAFVPYRSTRRLHGLGDGVSSGSTAGSYASYAQAIYKAFKGDVAGGAYDAAITFAGPIAAIGNAIANFANRKGDVDSAAVTALIDALTQAGFIAPVSFGRAGLKYLIPGCRWITADNNALEVARAIKNNMPADFLSDKMNAWLSSAVPVANPSSLRSSVSASTFENFCAPTPAPTPTPTPTPTPLPTPTPAPTPAPALVVYAPPISSPAPAPSPPIVAMPPAIIPPAQPVTPAIVNAAPPPSAPVVLPAASDAPAITVNVPASVPPDQTASLIQALIAQGASQTQAMTAALQSLAARGVPASAPVQAKVSQDVQTASNPAAASGMLPLIGIAALFGVALIMKALR